MRRALVVALLLAACAAPTGEAVDVCDGSWREVGSVIVVPGGVGGVPVPIECMRPIDERRVRIGFLMPPGPSCYRLSAIEVVEGADAVSITLVASPDDNPAAGACAEEEMRTATEIDLQAAVDDRTLLDGARAARSSTFLSDSLPETATTGIWLGSLSDSHHGPCPRGMRVALTLKPIGPVAASQHSFPPMRS